MAGRIGPALALLIGIAACSNDSSVASIEGYQVELTTAPPATAPVGTAVPIAFTILAHHSDNSTTLVRGQMLTLQVTGGNGTVNGGTDATVLSDQNGHVSLTWILGPTIGAQNLRGTLAGGASVDVVVSAISRPVAALAITTYPPSSANSGFVLSPQPTIELRDVNGNTVERDGVAIIASIASGTATLTGTTAALTDPSGTAAFGDLVVSGATGLVTLTFSATVDGTPLSVASHTITLAAAVATQLSLTMQPAATAISGVTLTRQPSVQLRDPLGNPVHQSGVVVTATIATGVGTLDGTTTAVTDASGVAAFGNLALFNASGTVTLRFTSAPGGQSASVTSTGIVVGPAGILAFVQMPSVVTPVGFPLFTEPVIQLQDAAGNPRAVAGVVVTASVGSGGASLRVATGSNAALTVLTDANGRATFHDLALGGGTSAALQFSAPGYTIVISGAINVQATANVTTLDDATPLGPFPGSIGDVSYYQYTVPAGAVSFDIATYSGSGNAEIFVRRGLNPTILDFDCHASVAGPSQYCNITGNPGGTYYVVVHAITALSALQIRAYSYNSNCAFHPLALGVTASGTITSASCVAEQNQGLNDRYAFVAPVAGAYNVTVGETSGASIFVAFHQFSDQRDYIGPFTSTGTAGPVLLGAGSYDIDVVDAFNALLPLSYTLVLSPTSPNPGSCKAITAPADPIIIGLMLSAADCAGTTAGTRSQRVEIVLAPGQTVTATMASTEFDPLMKLILGSNLTATAVPLRLDDNSGGGTTAQISYTNTDRSSSQIFTLELTSATAGATGNYTLTTVYGPAYYNIR
jgi:hypothetical protein